MDAILAALEGHRFDLANEKALQREIAEVFEAAGIPFEREVKLDDGVIDFLCGRVGVEVKIKGSKRDIYRQCRRYCSSPRIDSLILLTNRAASLPHELEGKCVTVFSLGRAWL